MRFSLGRLSKHLLISASFLVATEAMSQAPAFTFKVTGARQGVFKGDSTAKATVGAINAYGFSYAVTVPVDPATGQASGKRQHAPLVVTKMWDAASPQFMEAVTTNEVLPTVALTFTTTSVTGKTAPFFLITLKNATVTSVQQTVVLQANGTYAQMEQITFNYETIQETDEPASTTASDDWTQPG